MNVEIKSEADKVTLRTFFDRRIAEYQQELSCAGYTPQQYNILRGHIAELTDLKSALSLNNTQADNIV